MPEAAAEAAAAAAAAREPEREQNKQYDHIKTSIGCSEDLSGRKLARA